MSRDISETKPRPETRPDNRSRAARLGYVVLVAVALGAFVAMVVHACVRREHQDFELYYFAARLHRLGRPDDTTATVQAAVRAGLHPYRAPALGPFPLAGLIMEPLSLLGYRAAEAIFIAAASIVLLLGVVRAAPSWWPAWVLVLDLFGGFRKGLTEGQPSLLICGLLLLGLAWLRDRDDRKGGPVLGLAIGLKFYPVFLLAPLVARRWGALRRAVITAGVLVIAGALAVTTSTFGEAVRLVRTAASMGLSTSTQFNQSIPGVALRVFGAHAAASASFAVLWPLSLLFVLRWRAPFSLSLSAAVCLMLLTQSLSWEHYFPVALFAVMTAVHEAGDDRPAMGLALAGLALLIQGNPAGFLPTTGAGAIVNAPSMIGTALVFAAIVRLGRAGAIGVSQQPMVSGSLCA